MLKIVTVALLFHFCFQVTPCFGQHVFYQDVFRGGVTGGGGSTGAGAGILYFNVNIEPESTIRKAFLIAGVDGQPEDITVSLNGVEYELNPNSIVTTGFTSFYTTPPPSSINSIEVTNDINPTISLYELYIPPQQPITQQAYRPFFLVILYENSNLPEVAATIVLNEIDVAGFMNYSFSELLPINTSYDVGFSIVTKHFCNTTGDGSYIHVNGTNIGLVGGSDSNSSNWSCTGVLGHFYYHNGEFGGLDDDIPSTTMTGTDAIANIAPYVEENATELSIDYIYQTQSSETGVLSNPIVANFLAYTTPCQPFETTLTEEVTICRGDTAHLLATGGSTGSPTAYDWLPQEDLSCYNCPNPVFEGDSSKVYTVRIWNTDSCSKVLPVKVNVLDAPHSANLSTNPATCGESDGGLVIGSVSGGQPGYQYSLGNAWTANATANIFSNLPGGDYTFYVRDQNHCYYSQDFTIEEINPAHAAFTANPQSGTEPLDVNFYNQSSGTTHYEWMLLDSAFNSFEFNFTFDSAGSYPVQLISWYNEPHCADTAMATIIVNLAPPDYSHSIFMPTLYNLEIGDFFIETTNVQRVEFEIYNAIGQHIFSTTLDVADGKNEIWNGSRHARGYYFFRIKYWDVQGLEFRERGKVLVVR